MRVGVEKMRSAALRAEMTHKALASACRIDHGRAAMGEVGVPHQYIALFREEILQAMRALLGMLDQMARPFFMGFRAIGHGIPMFVAAAEIPIGQAVAARYIHEFACARFDILQRDPAGGQFDRPIDHDIGRVLMQALL